MDALRNLVNLKQKDNESLIDYTGCFKSSKDILMAQIWGQIKLTKFVTTMHTSPMAPTEAETKAYQKKTCKQLYAYIYLTNTDLNKYGTLIQGLLSQFLLGQDQYPKTIMDANSILSNHWFDAAYATQLKKWKEKEKASKDKAKDEQEVPEMSFAQMEGKCYCCGKPNHKSPNCCYKNKPKSKWAINKMPEIVQARVWWQWVQQSLMMIQHQSQCNQCKPQLMQTLFKPLLHFNGWQYS